MTRGTPKNPRRTPRKKKNGGQASASASVPPSPSSSISTLTELSVRSEPAGGVAAGGGDIDAPPAAHAGSAALQANVSIPDVQEAAAHVPDAQAANVLGDGQAAYAAHPDIFAVNVNGEMPLPFVNQGNGGVRFYNALNLEPEEAPTGRLAAVGSALGALLKLVSDIVRIAVYILKFPLIFFFAAYIFLLLTGYILDTATDSLAPVCAVFPRFYPCRVSAAAEVLSATFGSPGRKEVPEVQRADFPSLMTLQSQTLEQLLSHSAAGSQLAVGVKHAELAVKDLSIIVKASNLTIKHELSDALTDFAMDAKIVGRELQQLSAKLYGAVDHVLAFDEYALRSISSAQASGEAVAKATAVQMFQSTMSVLSTQISRVMFEAAHVNARLDALEEKLSLIRSLSEHEMTVTTTALGEVLSELWTFVGGNRARLSVIGRQVDILRNVDWYRGLSVAHVVATTETLVTVEAQLSELRDKLATPDLAGNVIPIEVHIASIERTARRLQEDRLKIRVDFKPPVQIGANELAVVLP